jgi:hypothetical protein
MAIAYASSTTFSEGNGGSVAGVAKPASTAIGDVLVAQMYVESGGGASPSTIASTGDAWTMVHNIPNLTPTPFTEFWVWVGVVGNASSTIGVTWPTGSYWRDFAVHRFTGVDTTTPQDVTATENQGTSGTVTGLGLASGTAGRQLVLCTANFDGTTSASWTSPLTERDDSGNVAMASGADSAGTDTANKTATIASSNWSAIMLALRPAGAGPSPTTLTPTPAAVPIIAVNLDFAGPPSSTAPLAVGQRLGGLRVTF